jgi:outer membrane protein TolC
MSALSRRSRIVGWLVGAALAHSAAVRGEEPPATRIGLPPPVSQWSQAAGQPDPSLAPLTLQEALTLARANSQQLRSAVAAAQLATEDRVQAHAGLLPGVSGFLQHIYTEPNGTLSGIFVANDGPRVYNASVTAHGDLYAPQRWADYRAAAAGEAVARAKADVATRGLVVTIVQNYYTLVAAVRKAASAQQSLNEAQTFLDITQRQERGGEVARADVVKAQIQFTQRQRDAQDAELATLKSRLGFSVLVFPDFRETFAIVDDLQEVAPLPPLETVKSMATENSPDLKAAEASVLQQSSGVSSARSGYLPSVSFDYWYGINANQFAIYDPKGHRLLGSVAQAQMTVPLWNWGATQSKLRQAQLRLDQAKADLTLTQRQLLANVIGFYREAEMARQQLDSLRASLDLATESLRLTTLRYQAGDATVLEVVDAQTTLIQSRNASDDGLVRYRVALATLQTITGTM